MSAIAPRGEAPHAVPGGHGAVLAISAIFAVGYTWTAWPSLSVVILRTLRSSQGRRPLAGGLAGGLAGVLEVGLAAGPDDYSATKTGEIVRADLVFGLVFGLAFGLTGGLTFGPAVGFAGGLTGGLVFGPIFGLAGMRYIALLSLTRRWTDRWLPWRLKSFLQWCYHAGLMRIAGIGYQFRHRELQDYLARNPADLGAHPTQLAAASRDQS